MKVAFSRIFNLQLEDFVLTLKKLLLFTAVLVLSLFSQVQAASVETVKAAIVKYSVEMGVDPAIMLSIAKVESGFNHNLKSIYGAVGVFQLLPSTARRMGFNPYSLDENIKGGIMYYKNMYSMFGSMQMAVAAYNAGPMNVKKYNAVPPFAETKRFVSAIMSDYYYLKAHTDPAIKAYYAAKKAEAKKNAEQKAVEQKKQLVSSADQSQTLPKVEHNQQVLANSKANDVTAETIQMPSRTLKVKPIENDLKVQSVQM